MILLVLLIALVLLLAPWLSGVPDEPLYSSWLCAAVMLAVLAAVSRAGRGLSGSRPVFGPAGRDGLCRPGRCVALLSLLFRLLREHGVAYLGPMLRGWTLLATDFALFALARRAAQGGRLPAYALVLTAVLASAIVAAVGVTEYLTHRRMGDVGWRIFATSTPDFLAGYLVLLLPLTLALFIAVPLRRKRPLIGYAAVRAAADRAGLPDRDAAVDPVPLRPGLAGGRASGLSCRPGAGAAGRPVPGAVQPAAAVGHRRFHRLDRAELSPGPSSTACATPAQATTPRPFGSSPGAAP